ncbi:MAG: hypothetical protein ABI203_02790, partial [Mucilaginibacter sp.]
DVNIQKLYVDEWEDDRTTEEKLTLNGAEVKSTYMDSPRVITANLSAKGDTLMIKSTTTMNRGGNSIQMTSNENWSLQNHGKELTIIQTSTTPRGTRKVTLVYDKQ